MRDSLPSSKHPCRDAHFSSLHSDHKLIRPEMIRNFNPGDVDLDELAEAIRQLLNPDSERTSQHRQGDPDLLSARRGGSHDVGAAAP